MVNLGKQNGGGSGHNASPLTPHPSLNAER
jgi:hypothetical protein